MLQEKKLSRVGSDKDITVDVRVVAATNKNLKEEIAKGNFREDLYHRLSVIVINVPTLDERKSDIPLLVDVINQSYTDLSVTTEQIIGYTQTEVFCPELWIAAVDNATSCIVGCGIADFDKELHEGILEWIQVIPAYRGQKIGQLLVNELLKRMANIAKFATVSGKVNNQTSPEMLYRKCGFVGNDIWHVLTR